LTSLTAKRKEQKRRITLNYLVPSKIRNGLGARSIEKALEILYSFEPNSPEQSLLQISGKLRFPASTAHRLLKVLASRDLIEQDSATLFYRLGPGILYLASITQNSLDVRKLAMSVMQDLRDSSGESVTLHELRGRTRVCIEKVDTTEVVREVILVGSQLPLHCGASGKVLLAHMEEHELKQYLSRGPLEALTPRTITDPNALCKELKVIRKDGFALSSGERVMDGLCAISAPIWDHTGRVNYSLTLSVPLYRLRVKGQKRLVRLLKQAGVEVSQKLGNGRPLAHSKVRHKPKRR
jgi:DNA-binding IclR family transcriptional regulator